jgi:PKD repeat protein
VTGPALVLHQEVSGATVSVWVEAGPGPVAAYLWEFGDGATSRVGPRASHTYRDPGEYRVSVAVQDDDGRWRVATADEVVDVP